LSPPLFFFFFLAIAAQNSRFHSTQPAALFSPFFSPLLDRTMSRHQRYTFALFSLFLFLFAGMDLRQIRIESANALFFSPFPPPSPPQQFELNRGRRTFACNRRSYASSRYLSCSSCSFIPFPLPFLPFPGPIGTLVISRLSFFTPSPFLHFVGSCANASLNSSASLALLTSRSVQAFVFFFFFPSIVKTTALDCSHQARS